MIKDVHQHTKVLFEILVEVESLFLSTLAAGQGHLNVLQWLIENGANVNIKNSVNETPRDIAIRFKQLACARLLECETSKNSFYFKELSG